MSTWSSQEDEQLIWLIHFDNIYIISNKLNKTPPDIKQRMVELICADFQKHENMLKKLCRQDLKKIEKFKKRQLNM